MARHLDHQHGEANGAASPKLKSSRFVYRFRATPPRCVTARPSPASSCCATAPSRRRSTWKRVRGIYRLNGDELTICFATGPASRPTKFAAPSGSAARLCFLKRKPVEVAAKPGVANPASKPSAAMPTSLRLDQAYLDALDRAVRRAVSEVVQEELKQSRGAACKPVMDALQRAFPDDQTVADLARRIIPARQRDERVPAALTALLIDFAQRIPLRGGCPSGPRGSCPHMQGARRAPGHAVPASCRPLTPAG